MTNDLTTPIADDDALPLTAQEVGDLDVTPQLFTTDGLVRLSYSAIDTYANCPAKYRYGYVFRLPGRSAPPLALGTAIHSALERFHEPGLVEMPSEDDLRAWLKDAWSSAAFSESPHGEEDDYKRRAWSAVTAYRERVAATWRPAVGTEVWFEVPIGGVANLVGSIDRLDLDANGDFHVIDYKTNRAISTSQRVAASLQLALYALAVEHAFNRLPATVALDFVVVREKVAVPVTELDLDAAREQVLATAQGIRDHDFPATPNPLCNWCDFKPICPAWTSASTDEQTLADATLELRALRGDIRRSLRLLRDKEAAVASLATTAAQALGRQADELLAHAERRAADRAAARAAEVEAAPPADAGPTLLTELAATLPASGTTLPISDTT